MYFVLLHHLLSGSLPGSAGTTHPACTAKCVTQVHVTQGTKPHRASLFPGMMQAGGSGGLGPRLAAGAAQGTEETRQRGHPSHLSRTSAHFCTCGSQRSIGNRALTAPRALPVSLKLGRRLAPAGDRMCAGFLNGVCPETFRSLTNLFL